MKKFTEDELNQVSDKIYHASLEKGIEEDSLTAINVSVMLELIKEYILELQKIND